MRIAFGTKLAILLALNAWAQSSLTLEQFLAESAVPKEVIDGFLRGPAWARFDPELGYIPGNYLPADGMDNSASISTVQPNGARTAYLYPNRACRINTYGDSFTHGDQVNDGETWQEYLAGHLGEPIRNFGVGGYGVYQAYRRMVREERTNHAAQNLVLYIWGDDHIRSLLRCRHAIIYKRWSHRGGAMFHANFWAHLEMDLASGRFVEKENPLNTPASLYRMTEPKFMVERLKDDLALQLYAAARGYTRELDRARVQRLAAHLSYRMDWDRADALPRQAQELLDRYSLEATRFVLEKAREFARQNRKKLLIVLFDPYRAMREMRQGGTRYDQPVVEFLKREKFDYFDMNEVQLRDFARYRIPFEEYMKLYFVGHYNPRGNHFFAYSIKDTIVAWLDPKPVPYRVRDEESVDFKGYLQPER
ncbi:MAG: hypothetical protein SFV51_06130 [Bryobacteraceae bacterium]|nr:hypothetical protein [Bryobacteraceae bacterium]